MMAFSGGCVNREDGGQGTGRPAGRGSMFDLLEGGIVGKASTLIHDHANDYLLWFIGGGLRAGFGFNEGFSAGGEAGAG
jgi:hypothetical protein